MFKFIATAALMMGIAGPLAAQECDQVRENYVFCAEDKWQQFQHPAFPEGMFIWKSTAATGKLLVETSSADIHIDTEIILDAIKDSVRKSLSENASANFLEHAYVDGREKSLGTISYDLTDGEDTLRTHHSVIVTDKTIMQYVTIMSGDDHEAGAQTHQDFLKRFKTVVPDYDT
jgi:hypothetical protein